MRIVICSLQMDLTSLQELPLVLEQVVLSYYRGSLAFKDLFPDVSLCREGHMIIGDYDYTSLCHLNVVQRLETSFRNYQRVSQMVVA